LPHPANSGPIGLSRTAFIATVPGSTARLVSIAHILGVGSSIKVIGVTTFVVVAGVTNHKPFGDNPVSKKVRKPMSKPGLTLKLNSPIKDFLGAAWACPLPTLILTLFVYSLPEIFWRKSSGHKNTSIFRRQEDSKWGIIPIAAACRNQVDGMCHKVFAALCDTFIIPFLGYSFNRFERARFEFDTEKKIIEVGRVGAELYDLLGRPGG
jgi:hypothetical protein